METCDFPPNNIFNLASALIIRLFALSCNLFFLIYIQMLRIISVLGSGFVPTTSASAELAVTGFMKAALGLRAFFFGAAFFTVFFAGAFPAAFFGAAFFGATFLVAGFFAFAILNSFK